MPIKIHPRGKPEKELAWLCDDDWDLPSQIAAMEDWLEQKKGKIDAGDYIADIGFRVRGDASGGGSALTPETMRIMADLGVPVTASMERGRKLANQAADRMPLSAPGNAVASSGGSVILAFARKDACPR